MPTFLLILSRALHYGSGMILVGVVAFRWFVLLPAFCGEDEPVWRRLAVFLGRLQTLLVWCAVTLAASWLLMFWAVTAQMSDTSLAESLDRDTLSTVLFQTRFGTNSICRMVLGAFWFVLLWRFSRAGGMCRRRRSGTELMLGLFATLWVAAFAATGHASANSRPGEGWQLPADVVHLITTSVWPAGLLPFALFLSAVGGEGDGLIWAPIRRVIARFSNVSLVAVVVIVASGLINSYFLVGSFQALISTSYGRILDAKLILFAMVVVIAAWNRFRLVPILASSAATENQFFAARSQLKMFVVTELILAAVIVVVVSFLGVTAPPR